MEQALGADFGTVRIHRDSEVAPAMQAAAFTHGNHVHFAAGEYAPTTVRGQRVLAHELVHTVQQGASARRSPIVQRDHKDTGLKKTGAIAGFAAKVKERVTGGRNPLGGKKEWSGLSDDAKVAKLVKYVNAELDRTHVPKASYTLDANKTVGNAEFDFQTWSLTIGSNGLGQDLTDDQLKEVADAVYHESRHAEQWFRIARLKAGEAPAPDAASLAQTLFVPAPIAKAAVDRPLKPMTKVQKFFRTKNYIERQDTKIAEAQSWYTSIYGTNAATRNDVLGDLDNRYNDYRALSEEVDAWDVGGKAGSKIEALLQALRLKQAAAAAAAAGG